MGRVPARGSSARGHDTYNPVEPAAFLTRLQTLGFGEITLTVGHLLLFRARKESAS